VPSTQAIHHILERLAEAAEEVRARFLTEVAEIISTAVMD